MYCVDVSTVMQCSVGSVLLNIIEAERPAHSQEYHPPALALTNLQHATQGKQRGTHHIHAVRNLG